MSTISGGCVCKAIKVTVTDKPSKVLVCYCTDCRKMSGHLGQILGAFSSDQVKIEDPDNKLKTFAITNTGSGKPNNVNFCQDCGCTVNSVPMVYGGETVLIRTPILDEGYDSLVPTEAIFTQDKCVYANDLAKL